MSQVKWVRITTDMFDNRKIRYLRKLPDGNNIVLVWVMLLTMAGRCNAGGMIFLTENIPYTPRMLSDELCFEEGTVLFALHALEELGMIYTREDGFITVPDWADYQADENTIADQLQTLKKQHREYVKQWRDKKRIQPEKNPESNFSESNLPTKCDVTCDSTCDVTCDITCDSTVMSHVIEEREREIEEKEEKESTKEKEEREVREKGKGIVEYLNKRSGKRFSVGNSATLSKIRARFEEGYTEQDFFAVIDMKCKEWIGTEFEKYIRPDTLFRPSNFEAYINTKGNGSDRQKILDEKKAEEKQAEQKKAQGKPALASDLGYEML